MRHYLAKCPGLRAMRGDPVACLARWRRERAPAERLLLVDFGLPCHWSGAAAGDVPLTALYLLDGEALRVAVTDAALVGDGSLEPESQYASWVEAHGLLDVDPAAPLPLRPLSIAKPWGAEIWYTGVERRGVCRFGEGGRSVPIPWLRHVLPRAAAGAPDEDLLLLKILASRPEPVRGELYFELHRHKREVYIITGVDATAWPAATGYMRYGICPQRLQQYADERQFRAAFLAAAADYEAIRQELDALPPGRDPLLASVALERHCRETLNGFTGLRPVYPGDVVAVPTRVPHALLHGLRAIEFQTPTYERLILSFPQRLVTQDRWDTRAAVAEMELQVPPDVPASRLQQADGVCVDRIAAFPDFEVRRLRLEGGRGWSWPPLRQYALLMVVEGELALGTRVLSPEQAVLLPAGWAGELRVPGGVGGAVLLAGLPLSEAVVPERPQAPANS